MASVARQPAAASMMARVERLDLLLGYLEEMHHRNSATSSPSTPAAAAATAFSDSSSAASTPRGSGSRSRSRSWRRASCRPAKEVLEEAQAKGSLVDRIAFLEDRVLKMEKDMEITPEKTSVATMMGSKETKVRHGHGKKKGLKGLVKSCVRGKLSTKD